MGEVGLSTLIGLKAAVLFSAFLLARNSGVAPISPILLHASLVSFLVAVASHPSINLPLLLGKRADGSFPIWSAALFAPYLAFIRLFVVLRRMRSGEPAYTQVSEGLYVGAWPSSTSHLPPGDPAVVDCTCELPRTAATSQNAYLCVATWDTRAPLPAEIASAVRWARRQRAQSKPVFVHCAFGHGRSVCVMCALLVALGRAEDWKAAEKMIKERRPFIRMNSLHRRRLEQWSKHLVSPR
ncbi:uncharacterized protein LOC144711260 [Wolffia australiana]